MQIYLVVVIPSAKMKISFKAILVCIFSCVSQGEGCSEAVNLLPNLTQRSMLNDPRINGYTVSDHALTAGWYRTYVEGTQYLMADSHNTNYSFSCGSVYPVYLSEIHPNITELQEGTTYTYFVCLTIAYGCNYLACHIRRCGDEIQYYLYSTLLLNSSYCFDPVIVDKSENGLSAVALAFIIAACCLTVCGLVVLGYILKRYCEKESDDSHMFVLPKHIPRNRVYPSKSDDVPDLPTLRAERYDREQTDDSDSPPPFWTSVKDGYPPPPFSIVRDTNNIERGTDDIFRGTDDIVRETGYIVRGTDAIVRGTDVPFQGSDDRVRAADDIVHGNDDRAIDDIDRNANILVRGKDDLVRGTDAIGQSKDNRVQFTDDIVQETDKTDSSNN